jgi:hypothetical protein
MRGLALWMRWPAKSAADRRSRCWPRWAAADTAYALGSLQIRQYDPLGNLRKAGE